MRKTILAALASVAFAASASAQDYPTRNITFIVPFPAGGPSDIVARIAAEAMQKHLGQNIVIENVAGAGGTTGATRAAEANPDGYTLFAASMGTIIAAPTFYPNLKYDSNKDFEPIGMSANAPAAHRRQQQRAGQGHEGIHRLGEDEGRRRQAGAWRRRRHLAHGVPDGQPGRRHQADPWSPIAAWAPA